MTQRKFVLAPDIASADVEGFAQRMKILTVNGKIWSLDEFKSALGKRVPLDFLILQNGRTRTIHVNYLGGERHPHLEALPDSHDLLSNILAPRSK